MSTVLLTGFQPYGENPAERVARLLHGRLIDGASVQSWIVPISFIL
jgi:pyrrolidone-carboxylate peptidase